MSQIAATPAPTWLRVSCWGAFALGLAALVHGLVRVEDAVGSYSAYAHWMVPAAGAWVGLGVVGARLFPGRLLAVGVGAMVLALASSLGLVVPVVLALVATASWVVGDALFARALPADEREPVTEGLVGVAGLVALVGVLYVTSHLRIHRPGTYLLLLGLPCVLRSARTRRFWGALLGAARGRPWSGPLDLAALWLLLGVLWIHLLNALRPEIGHDALVSHLAIPHMVAVHQHFSYPFQDLLWSLMPHGGDWAFTLVAMFGGEEAVHGLLFVVLATTAWLLTASAGRWVPSAAARLLGALMASTSICYCLSGSAYVDGFVGLLQFGVLLAVLGYDRTRREGYLALAAVLLGGAIYCKLTSVLMAFVVLALVVGIDLREGRLRGGLARYAKVVALTALVGAFPYVNAWVLSGIPTHPFYGELFTERVLPAKADLERFVEPITPRLLYDLTFHSNRFLEAEPGAFGYFGLLLVPLAPLLLLGARRRAGWVALGLAVGSFLAVFLFQSYLRYVVSALPMFLVALAVGLGWLRSADPRLWRTVLASGALLVVFQVRQLPAAAPWIQPLPLKDVLRGDREELRAWRYHAKLIDYLNLTYGTGCRVLFTAHPYVAGLDGEPLVLAWYSPAILAGIEGAEDVGDVDALLRAQGVTHLVVHGEPDPGRSLWEAWLVPSAALEYRDGEARLYRVLPAGAPEEPSGSDGGR